MITRRLVLLAALALLILVALPAAAQEPPPVFQQAVADLSARAGRSLTTADFANYAWAQDTYPDTGFGCPTPPAEVRPGPVSGYLITITLEGVTYDYRAAADGSILFLCGQSGEGAPAGSTAAPVTPGAPESCPTGFIGYLEPRLTVGGQARVGDGDFPNRLRSAPTTSAQQIGLLAPGDVMVVVGGPTCADTFVWWQVRAGTQTGWTAEGTPPDDYWLEPVGGAADAPTPAPGVMPQFATDQDGAIALWTVDGGEWTALGEIIAPPMTEDGAITQIVFSPDGTKLAVRVQDYAGDQIINRLYAADAIPGASLELIADDLFTDIAVSFTDTGLLLYAVEDKARGAVQAPGEIGSATVIAQVFAQDATPGAAREPIAEYGFGLGCGGGWSYPAVGAYFREAGYGGRPLTLASTEFGLLHTTNCSGSGLQITDLTSSAADRAVTVSEHLSRVSLSPDGTRLLGFEDDPTGENPDTLTLIDLATRTARPVVTANPPQQAVWTADGRIVYTSFAETGDPVPGTTAEAFTSTGFTAGIPARALTISALDPLTGAESVLYTGPGFQVGRLLPVPGGGLLFSVIPAGESWANAVAANGIPADVTMNALFWDYFQPLLFWLPEDGTAEPLGTGFLATLNPAAFAAG